MELETINPYVLKIIIAARKVDSISSISKRIGLSYGWTYKWVDELAELGIFTKHRMKLALNENKAYRMFLDFIRANFSHNIGFHYSVLGLFGIEYCFTSIDSVFIWTKGGYNIARYSEYYPIFIDIKETDFTVFKEYCRKLNLRTGGSKGAFYRVRLVKDIVCEKVDDIPVEPLDKTIRFMEKHIYNFEPALEMIKEMYGKRTKVRYKEALTNV